MNKEGYPPAPKFSDYSHLGTWSQYTTESQAQKSGCCRDAKSGGVGEMTEDEKEDNGLSCPNCKKWFLKKRRNQRFCKAGCRTYYCRKRIKALIPAIWEAFGVSYDGAVAMLEKVGAAAIAEQLEKMGYRYDGDWWELPDEN